MSPQSSSSAVIESENMGEFEPAPTEAVKTIPKPDKEIAPNTIPPQPTHGSTHEPTPEPTPEPKYAISSGGSMLSAKLVDGDTIRGTFCCKHCSRESVAPALGLSLKKIITEGNIKEVGDSYTSKFTEACSNPECGNYSGDDYWQPCTITVTRMQ
jgi:hypothetical protein